MKNNSSQHRIRIVNRCCHFVFQIQGINLERPKVFFFGKQPMDHQANVIQQALQGFASDAATMIALYLQETELCRNSVNRAIEEHYPDNFIKYISNQFGSAGLGKELETATDEVGRGGELVFF